MPSDEVIVHAPEHSEAGAIGVGGRHALKTYRRQDTKFKPLIFSAVAGFVLLAVLVAIVIRTSGKPPEMWLLALGAMALGPPCAWAGYTFLRDAELEPYRGTPLAVRTLICGLVFALMWGVYWFVGTQWGGPDAFAKGLEIYQFIVLGAIPLGIGSFVSFVSLDLEPINAFLHCAMYFAVTVLLRWVADMHLMPGLIFGT
jgi:cation transport ATPase